MIIENPQFETQIRASELEYFGMKLGTVSLLRKWAHFGNLTNFRKLANWKVS